MTRNLGRSAGNEAPRGRSGFAHDPFAINTAARRQRYCASPHHGSSAAYTFPPVHTNAEPAPGDNVGTHSDAIGRRLGQRAQARTDNAQPDASGVARSLDVEAAME